MPEIWKFYIKFGHLILRKMNKFVATRCKPKMHKIQFRLGVCPQTPVGELTALPQSLSWISGAYSKEGERRWKWKGEGEGKG